MSRARDHNKPVAEVVVTIEEEAEEKAEVAEEEAKVAEEENLMMPDHALEPPDSMRMERKSSSLIREKVAASKERTEVIILSTSIPEPAEAPESHKIKKVEPEEATGATTQPSKARTARRPQMVLLQLRSLPLRVRPLPNQPRSRKRRPGNQKRRLKR
jgi:hypothetical protein